MAEAVRLSIKGDRELRRKLRHFAKGRTRWKMTRKTVNAGLTPILNEARRRVPEDIGDLLWWERAKRIKKKTVWQGAQRDDKGEGISGLVRRNLTKRMKGYPARGIIWGGVGPRTRIRIRLPGWDRPVALSTLAWETEFGATATVKWGEEWTKVPIPGKPPRPFMRPAFDSRRTAAVLAMKRKLDIEIAKEAKVG